ncbi:MAG: methyltransferase domain-containing protein [Alcanivoracaceae bacterium]|jgi:cyclopropane fatty-acyl-phospholipid synthase-like methyltransferase|nr:methyltransferase domain-containing protein [Alcanivoracaceae bacterium]
MARKPEHFDIAGDLLAGPGGDGRWNNLGYWKSAQDYTGACRALAEIHGVAAGLTASHRLLELACGYGAALDVWGDCFDVSQMSVLDYRPDCTRHIRSLGHLTADSVRTGSFDEPLDALFPGSFFDAVICVDAAYHARSLAAFTAAVEPVLAEQGVLVFSTLTLVNAGSTGWFGNALLNGAGISPASLMTESDLRQTVAAQGLVVTAVEDISDAVFAGFADWVARRSRAINWREKYSPAWLKIAITAHWCHRLSAGKSMRYVLVSVCRPQSG